VAKVRYDVRVQGSDVVVVTHIGSEDDKLRVRVLGDELGLEGFGRFRVAVEVDADGAAQAGEEPTCSWADAACCTCDEGDLAGERVGVGHCGVVLKYAGGDVVSMSEMETEVTQWLAAWYLPRILDVAVAIPKFEVVTAVYWIGRNASERHHGTF
jgi:hypothetical protein